ncbi:trigger factor [Catenulispora acidiphila DSM 44928]|uniref:Trigger factor n=1 Tax=Catenulispora acidiphila (strain DSM 44928 / JCM 14897 / NBRC 102108 / NRRL B-24433 / ID139908) TaxID=479433 RepID=C7Q8D7_CATAD|nr:trigger factor [Catenulispora acidiphila]ACU76125.1 trigger factor [Catenulispora acidiphila DSM 44928]
MKSAVETLDPTRVRLTVEVPFEELKPSLDAAYKKIAEQVSIPGFRKGKVPAAVIDQRFGRGAALEEAINSSLPQFYGQAVEDNKIEVVGQPDVDLKELEPGQDLKFTAEVDVRPEFDVPAYDDIEVEVEDAAVAEEAVAERIEEIRKRFGSLKEVEREVADGDFVTLDLAASIDGEVLEDGTAKGMSYEVGSTQLIEGTDEAIIGKKAGETATFTSKLLGGSHAGEDATIEVTVSAVKERELPELDDEFAQLASEFDTMEEFRANVRETLERSEQFEQVASARDKVLEVLLERVEIPLPKSVVDSELAWRNEALDRQIAMGGMTREGFFKLQEKTEEEYDAELAEEVRDGVKAQFILDKLANAEEISVNEGELTNHLIQRAQQAGMRPDEFAQQISSAGQIPALVGEVRRGKALNLVLEAAKVKDASGNEVDVKKINAPDVEDTDGENPDSHGRAPEDEHYGHKHD